MIEFTMFGIPFVGADLCGFRGESDANLCIRWHQLGAMQPFCRNHNFIGEPVQDPAGLADRLGDPTIVPAVIEALNMRYQFLPYFYTLFYKAHINADPPLRSLAFQYPTDPMALQVDKQYLFGPGMMIVPVVENNTESVTAYVPDGIWYWNGTKLQNGTWTTLNAPLTSMIPVLLQGGYVFPRQGTGNNTNETRQTPFELLIAFDAIGNAAGELFWDDGEELNMSNNILIEFKVSQNQKNVEIFISISKKNGNSPKIPTLDSINLIGLTKNFANSIVELNGAQVSEIIWTLNSDYWMGLKLQKSNFIDLNETKNRLVLTPTAKI